MPEYVKLTGRIEKRYYLKKDLYEATNAYFMRVDQS